MLLQNSQSCVILALLAHVQAASNPQLPRILPPILTRSQGSTPLIARQTGASIPLPAVTALVDCPVWPIENPLLKFPPKSCVHVIDVVLEDGKIEIFREAAGWTNSAIEVARLDAVYRAASLALPYYQPTLARPLQVKLSLLKTIGGKPGKTVTANGEGIPCFVDVALALDRLDAQYNTYIGNIIIHELYHCVQLHNRQGQLPTTAVLRWWFEGSAKFFEYFMYPRNIDADLDDNAPHKYQPREPLYLQPYNSSLFFHFLHNRGWSLARINDWIRTRKYNTDAKQERVDLTADRDIAENFGMFAVAFHDKNIMFDSKGLPAPFSIITANEIQVNGPVQVSIPAASQKYRESIRMKTWTFEKFTIALPPKQKISMTVEWLDTTVPEVEIWYRRKRSTGNYSKWSKSIPYDLHTGCGKSTVTYEFIIAPVAKTESVDGYLVFTREENDACKCKIGTPGGPIKRAALSLALDLRQSSGNNFTGSSLAGQTLTMGSPSLGPDQTSQTLTLAASPSATGMPNTPDEKDEDEDESCSTPISCLIGHWTIANGGMDAHLTKPFFRYSPTGFNPDTAKFSGKYTIAFSEPTPELQLNSSDSMLLLFHEVLTEELENSARRDITTPWKTLFASSTSTIDGSATVFVTRTESGAEHEVGMLARKVVNSTGEMSIVLDGGPPSLVKTNGLMYGPRGNNWDFNCSDTTLVYTSRVAPQERTYTFNKV